MGLASQCQQLMASVAVSMLMEAARQEQEVAWG